MPEFGFFATLRIDSTRPGGSQDARVSKSRPGIDMDLKRDLGAGPNPGTGTGL